MRSSVAAAALLLSITVWVGGAAADCPPGTDQDGDGICDDVDNCPIFPNPDQTHPEICTPAPYETLTAEEEARFDEDLDQFAEIETSEDGLGPVFNGASCAECHNRPPIGGTSTRFVTRFGRYGVGGFDAMSEYGGSLIQQNGITTGTCSVPGEIVPPEATVSTRRATPPLFGLGLVERSGRSRIDA